LKVGSSIGVTLIKKYLLSLGVFAFAFAILSISILESSSISYSFKGPPPQLSVLGAEIPDVNYPLPSAGTVLPDNPLWNLKALRDKIWYAITPSPLKKAELALLFSDKRLVSAQILFEKQKTNIATSTLGKGEKYLEIAINDEAIARAEGYNTSDFLSKLATAALKHREVIENLMPFVPDDGKPFVIKTEDYSKNTYKVAGDVLKSKGLPVPINPFDGD
jgi:hypothetical protein